MNPVPFILAAYIAVGAFIAGIFVWVHYSAPDDQVRDQHTHYMVREKIVLVVLWIVVLWFPVGCEIIFAKIKRKVLK